jgi:hypothetical protein
MDACVNLGLDGQPDFNVLTLNYSNHLSFPTTWALALVAQKFTQASNCPLMVGLGDMAAFGEDGSKVRLWPHSNTP